METQKIVIASNFTSEPVKPSLDFLLRELNVSHDIEFGPFNQLFQQLLAPSSAFHSNVRGANVIIFRSEDFVEAEGFPTKVLEKIETNIRELQAALKPSPIFQVPLLIVICPPSNEIKKNKIAVDFIQRIEATFAEDLKDAANVHIFSASDFLDTYKVREYDNPKADLYGRIPYTAEFFAALGAFLARKIYALCAEEPYKVIVLDCDQTLWKGVCGEDGVDGVEFDAPRLALQKFMAAQSEAGMLLCLCSKNNEPDVWNVFDCRTEMLLKREHIVASKINWNFKSANLRRLAAELGLGLSSFIFVDDDPAVCAEVRANCPEVLTLWLPAAAEEIPSFLDHVWAFDKLKTTEEDRLRTKSYRQQAGRARLQESAATFEDFLAKLQLKCEIAEAGPAEIPRVSQLSLRTNQFNSTTKRRSENDLMRISGQNNKHVWTISVEDRFGDYGLVGAIVYEKTETSLEVDSFMLSCRALGRGVEHRMLSALGQSALGSNCDFVNIEFIKSAKNEPVQNFLEDAGSAFRTESDTQTFYRFPAEIAAQIELRYASKTAVLTVENQKGDRLEPESKKTISVRNEAICRIAGNLRTARQILAATKTAESDRRETAGNLIAPRNETERRLAEIWQRTLHIGEIGIRDNFFELGGDSLQAVSLFVDIEDAFGQHLPLTVLIDSPTIEKMSERLDPKRSTDGLKYLVAIKPEGSRTPLFCMHAAGGNVLFYRDLANGLDADQPVYGLQARGVADKSETAHDNVQEMATEYLKEIRSVQPVGPYQVCGSSFGGLIAFEIACQLAANGEAVSLLALFDTYAPGYPERKPDAFPFESKLRGLLERAVRLREQVGLIETPREKAAFFHKQFQKLRLGAKRKKIWKENQFEIEYAKSTGRRLPKNIQRNHLAIQRALDTYAPPIYKGQMTLFRAALQPTGIIFDATLGWKKWTAGEIRIEDVPGSHGALTVYPFAKHLADKLSPFLKDRSILAEVERFAVV